jgi:histidinol-phosphate/aromatic aminotransferase/cobyric acid decarboxylase-like protein
LLEPARKCVKTTGSDEAIDLLVSVLKDQQSGSGRVCFNTVELAIQLLQIEYKTHLSEGHFLLAVDVLTAEAKASVFITLNSSIRDT